MKIKFPALAYILIHTIRHIQIISHFPHLKLWIAVAKRNFLLVKHSTKFIQVLENASKMRYTV